MKFLAMMVLDCREMCNTIRVSAVQMCNTACKHLGSIERPGCFHVHLCIGMRRKKIVGMHQEAQSTRLPSKKISLE